MKKALFILFGFFIISVPVVSAAVFHTADVYELKENVFSEDLYAAGGSVDVSGNVGGDAILAGGEVGVHGNVAEDALAAGGRVILDGNVNGDARLAGGEVTVGNDIGDDLIAFGGFIKVLSDSHVGGDMVVAGGTVVMNGTVSGDLTAYANEVSIDGAVNGNVTLNYSKKVTLGPDTFISGDLTYSSEEELEIPEGVKIGGEVTRVETPASKFHKEDAKRFFGLLLFGKFLMVLITGLVLVLIFKNISQRIGENTVKDFWKHALYGFVTTIVVFILFVLLLITFFGMYLGFLMFFAFILLMALAKAYAGVVAGALLSKWIKKKVIVDWKWALLGIVVMGLVFFIPVLGPLAVVVLVFSTLGTLLLLAKKPIWLKR